MNRRSSKRVPPKISAMIHIMYNEMHMSVRTIQQRLKKINLAVSTIWRHAKSEISICDKAPPQSTGRPSLITEREKRIIERTLHAVRKCDGGRFTAQRLQVVSGVTHVSLRTFRRYLNNMGFAFRPTLRKGLLVKSDLPKRLRFAKEVVKHFDAATLWKEEICFYFDGKSFVHKYNPRDQARAPGARIWRRSDEGLNEHCTSKGKKAGNGGRTAHFFVGMSYRKGVILCEPYEKLDGQIFADFVTKHFPVAFNKSYHPYSRSFLQDGDPSQNSKKAKVALSKIGAVQFSIPPRSPDCNPIENMFSWAERKLAQDAIDMNITYETFSEFSARVKQTMESCPVEFIDKLIDSMPGRMLKIIATKGKRLRY